MNPEDMSKSIKAGKITVMEDAFHYKGSVYVYEDIEHIYFYGVKATQTNLGIPTGGQASNMYLDLYLSNGKKLKSKVGSLIIERKKTFNEFHCGYLYISKKTFAQRYNSYIKQIQDNGYFVYDDHRFYPDGRFGLKGRASKNLRDFTFWRDAFDIHLKPKGDLPVVGSFMQLFRRIITTRLDQDVFLALMNKLYGVRL